MDVRRANGHWLEPTEDDSLQIMYGIDGRRDLTESTRDELSGYDGARPVRLGNGAFDQRQNDVYGAVLDSILLHARRSERLPRRLWPIVETQVQCATKVWREPDQGIWEARGKPQHYVSSKLMCWVAFDRAAKLAEIRGDPNLQQTWRAFLICSFWLVSALSIIGEKLRARDLMERLLRIASPLGLYAEEFETESARHLGNFPQAFSHLALIEAAARIIVSERLEEVT
jgi:GH15 family glucan-1,4-alpha-glucosidase